jgi:ribosomal protein S12 methylthiotransferase accessory factor YcaO
VISGARDDFTPAGYGAASRALQWEIASHWLRSPARRPFATAPDRASPNDLAQDLESVLVALGAAGMRQVAWVDLSQPKIGIPVVRVIVPNLEGPWTPETGEYVPGTRARAARGAVA